MEQSQPSPGDARLRRLKWLCRRGMKELDVLLEQFLASHEAALKNGQWPEFEALLEVEDDRLWDFILQPKTSRKSGFYSLLAQISPGRTDVISKPD